MPARNALFFVFFLFKTKLTAAHTCGVKCKVMELDRQLNSFPTCSCSPFSEHFMVIIIQVVAFLSGTMSIEQVKEKFGNLYSTGGKKKKCGVKEEGTGEMWKIQQALGIASNEEELKALHEPSEAPRWKRSLPNHQSCIIVLLFMFVP